MFLYKIVDGGVRITECRGRDSIVTVPEEIDGCAVTELAPYAFSKERRGNAEVECPEDAEKLPRVCGGGLTEIYLPDTLRKIGNYAFYNCEHLEKISCAGTIADLGSGIFTGCTGVRELEIRIEDGKRSCFQELISELRQELYVTYTDSSGTARLIFPEFYEEAVENTPAKVLKTEMHGCGHRYRYCFDKREFQFKEYDSLFPHVRVQEPDRLVVRLALGRLMYPLGLLGREKSVYASYLKEHLLLAAEILFGEKNQEGLMWLTEKYVNGRETLDRMIELANRMDYSEGLSYLMDFRHRNYQSRSRRFGL